MSDGASQDRVLTEEFEPGADPKQRIEQHAGPYRERPVAMLREMLQDASDVLGKMVGGPRVIEVAILNPPQSVGTGTYHLAIRDSGRGMTEDKFRREIGILGMSTSRGNLGAVKQ